MLHCSSNSVCVMSTVTQCNSSWNNYLYTDSPSDSRSSQSQYSHEIWFAPAVFFLFSTHIWWPVGILLILKFLFLQTYSHPLLLKLQFSFSILLVSIMFFFFPAYRLIFDMPFVDFLLMQKTPLLHFCIGFFSRDFIQTETFGMNINKNLLWTCVMVKIPTFDSMSSA